MSKHAPNRGRWVLAAVLTIGASVVSPRTLFSQPPQLEGAGLALDLLERLEYTRAGAEAVTASMSLVVFEKQYCLPPDQPSKAREEQFLKAREATVDEYRRRYNTLRAQLLTLITRDASARRAVDAKFNGNPMAGQAWSPWTDAFRRAMKAIADKRKELAAIPVVRCSIPQSQQTTPDPVPPAGPGITLPQPKVRPVTYPTYKTPFCSESEKQTVIQQFRAVAWDYYLNYQDAREYHDAITGALTEGRGNAGVLRNLLPAARASLDAHAKALDDFHKELDRVRALPVVDCNPPQQTVPDPIPPLLFDPFVYPAVLTEFCTQAAKDETVRQLDAARRAAQRNYDKAAARIIELGDRIAKGDNSATTSAAFREASDAATSWLQQSRTLEADMQRAASMPVVECPEQKNDQARTGFQYGTGIRVGLTYSWSNFSRFQGFVGDQDGIATATSDETVNQLGVFSEITKGTWYYGGAIRYGQHQFGQTFQPGGGRPSLGTGTVDGYFADLYGGRRWGLGSDFTAGAYTGPVLTYNRGRMVWTYGNDLVEDSRSHTSLKWGLGGYIDVGPRSNWYGRVGVNHVSVNSDADDHTGIFFGAGYVFTRAGVGFARPGPVPQSSYEYAIRARLDSLRAVNGRSTR